MEDISFLQLLSSSHRGLDVFFLWREEIHGINLFDSHIRHPGTGIGGFVLSQDGCVRMEQVLRRYEKIRSRTRIVPMECEFFRN